MTTADKIRELHDRGMSNGDIGRKLFVESGWQGTLETFQRRVRKVVHKHKNTNKPNKKMNHVYTPIVADTSNKYKNLTPLKTNINPNINIRIKDEKWLAVGDCHFPYGDKKCIDIIIDYAKDEKVDNLIIMGDCFDFHEISRWGDKFRKPFEDEVAESEQMLNDWIISRIPFKNKKFIKGNHCDRLERYITNNARKIQNLLEKKGFDLPHITGIDKMGFDYIDNIQLRVQTGSFFKIGHLHYIHGHEIAGSGKYPARAKLMNAHDNILFGHYHKTDEAIEFDLSKKPSKCWSIGCSCGLIPEYSAFNSWNQGFAIVTYKDNKKFSVNNKIIVDEDIY